MHLSNVQWKRRILKPAATKNEGRKQRILGGSPAAAARGISAQTMEHRFVPEVSPHRGLQALESTIQQLFFEYLQYNLLFL